MGYDKINYVLVVGDEGRTQRDVLSTELDHLKSEGWTVTKKYKGGPLAGGVSVVSEGDEIFAVVTTGPCGGAAPPKTLRPEIDQIKQEVLPAVCVTLSPA